ncbi:MAG: bifunctional indole-3-glycerol-phosphate synthase TrpC/phosphoribosylanthranilate isomerase TrpF [Aliivibrio sp.]|uniref:bifunctional indole-3-glycerol-phosphate synthase TrpC/phosphoribosylanthranilate isomerase TrpF n=1 Tax=Aliivibrio sp. TaxID=1872443 RepID=UPI001A4974AF|nr:bifunctional indole-3-glycerol-phosphate synthase TrpC/phosphoribosylanthranilate isomerase TrpF [Aliivibrio sp.]
METVLAKIVADKRIWIEERKKEQPLESFKESLTTSDRDFYAALSTDKTAFILECKKASPSKGLIRDDFDLDYIASVYNNHASAISVLTDEKYFQGNFDFLPQVRNQVTQPVLCKDFMVDPYQIYLARHYQADAILLMLSVLDDQEYQQLAQVAHSLHLGILTEVSNEQELQRAITLKANIVGINNRNLRDLSIDLDRTKQLAPKLPKGIVIISESGIYNHQQVKMLSQYANGFLIGSSLMAEDNIELAARKVILGENKVCGLTHPEDSASVYLAGSVYGGLIFVEKSPRFVDIEQARIVMSGAPLHYVGVFQNHAIEHVVATANTLKLTAVQLHGDEDHRYIEQLRQALPEQCAIWNAHGVSSSDPSIIPKLDSHNIDRHLLDAKVGSQSGGTGKTFDWRVISDLLNNEKNIMLAGGLTPDNAQQASQLGCLGLDFNSGVESAPGKKDIKKLQAAFTALRNY